MVKRAVSKLLRKLGYKITKIDAQFSHRSHSGKFSPEVEDAHSKLPAQIEEFKKIHTDPKYWKGPKRVISYLTKERLQHYFDQLELVHQNSIELEGKKIADIGCYFPYLFHLISQEAPKATLHGYDFNNIALSFGEVLAPNAEFFTMDLFDIKQKYDVIFCTEVLEHLVEPDKALQHLYHITNKGGTIVLTVPIGRQDSHHAGEKVWGGVAYHGHVNLWTLESWEIFCNRHTGTGAGVEVGELDERTYFALISRTSHE